MGFSAPWSKSPVASFPAAASAEPSRGQTPVSLLDRLRSSRQDPDWERFLHIYRDLIRVWLVRAGTSRDDLEDLHQEILMALLEAIPEFEHNGRRGAFRKWLKTLVVHRVLHYLRTRRRRVDRGEIWAATDPALLVEDRMLSDTWEREHDEHVLRTIMDLVEPEFTVSSWLAFKRQVVEHQGAAAVARELGMSTNAVLIAKSRVLRRLRAEAAGLID